MFNFVARVGLTVIVILLFGSVTFAGGPANTPPTARASDWQSGQSAGAQIYVYDGDDDKTYLVSFKSTDEYMECVTVWTSDCQHTVLTLFGSDISTVKTFTALKALVDLRAENRDFS